MEEVKRVNVSVLTKNQVIKTDFYCDTIKQDCIDFVRDMSRLHDSTESYNVSVRMYSDINTLDTKLDIISDNIFNVISFVGFYVNEFLGGK